MLANAQTTTDAPDDVLSTQTPLHGCAFIQQSGRGKRDRVDFQRVMALFVDAFAGNERFLIERLVGHGGFGVVYQVFDRHQQAQLALKVLRQSDALHRLKREFRTLANLSHPNLVQLYELLSDGNQSFITMELLNGPNLVDFVREGWFDANEEGPSLPNELAAQVSLFNLDRVKDSFAQLAEGLHFLHSRGKLHRDIKPSNILVTRPGRVVLLDFGLATDASSDEVNTLEDFGTPAYMPPEQATGQPLTEAADWYSAGVVLFQALTGHLPFEGSPLEMVKQKRTCRAPALREHADGIPEWLDELCQHLLARNPADRITGEEVLRKIRQVQNPMQPTAVSLALPVFSSTNELIFVGREAHLNLLTDAFDAAREGQTITMYVHGSSGAGKTALVRRFLKNVAEREPNVVVLAGRCYERESVPYKALDSLVDALSRYLVSLPQYRAEAVLPRDVRSLERLFPVFRRVESIRAAHHRGADVIDAQELRRRAFAALRELLSRLGDRRVIVLSIDDLQWGDVDSAELLSELLRPPDAPALLFIGAYRSEEVSTSPSLRTLLSKHPPVGMRESVRELEVTALATDEARTLVGALLGTDDRSIDAHTEAIVREARGSPFFINELIHHARTAGWDAALTGTLDDAILGRVMRLSEGARQLLDVLAISGQPLERSVVRRVAGLGADELAAVASLRAASLIRTRATEGREEIEPYHDRIRETVSSHLSRDDWRATHRRLAIVLKATDSVDPESSATHFHEGGDPERAAKYAESAAERASDALAFDRAARLYRLALDLKPATNLEHSRLHVQLGDALANAGRGSEAAEAYLAAVESANASDAIELRRRAALQLLISGQITRGISVLRAVLTELGMSMAETPRGALFSILVRRARARVRGTRFRHRDESQVSSAELIRVDACWSAAVGLGLVDTIRGAEFQARHLLLALHSGEPYRVGRALALQAPYIAAAGVRMSHRVDALIAKAEALAERVNRPQAFALVSLVKGIAAFMVAEWKTASRLCQQAEQILRERCTGVAWELDTAYLFRMRSLVYMGDVGELSRQLPILYKEARERGDLLLETYLGTNVAYLSDLASDDPALAVRARAGSY